MSSRNSIPEAVRSKLRARLDEHAASRWKGACREVLVRYRGRFAYVDALRVAEDDSYAPWLTKGERAQIDRTPIKLCRLGYTGSPNLWEFSFYKYSDSEYEPSLLPSGFNVGTPEEAFDCAADVYLTA